MRSPLAQPTPELLTLWPGPPIPHVWPLQCPICEEGGSAALPGGLAQLCEGFPSRFRLETILSAECSTWSPADWTIVRYKSFQTPESLFLFVVKWILLRFPKPLLKNQSIFKRAKFEACTKSFPIHVCHNITFHLSVLNIYLSEFSWISISQG